MLKERTDIGQLAMYLTYSKQSKKLTIDCCRKEQRKSAEKIKQTQRKPEIRLRLIQFPF